MTSTLDDITTAGQAYGDARYQEAWTAQQGTIDSLAATHASDTVLVAQLNGQVALDTQQLAALQAQLDALTPAEVKVLTDFAQQQAGLYLGSGTLHGRGVTKTIYRLPANTSKLTTPTTDTNQLKLMRAGGTTSAKAARVDLAGFTIEGTDQPNGLQYGGLVVGYGSGSTVQDLAVTGITGAGSSPQTGETFSLALFHADSATLARITLDGRRTSDGAQVAATLLGGNYTTGQTVVTDLVAQYALYGFGVALFGCSGAYVLTRADLRYNRKAINIEKSGACSYDFNACDFRGTKIAPYVAQVSTGSLSVSNPITFRDPVVDAWPLQVRTYGTSANGGTNGQKDADIRLILNGVDVSDDPTKLQRVHTG